MSFSTAVKHKLVVSEIAAGAAGEGKTALLGVLYDEIARRVCCICSCSLAQCSLCPIRKEWEDKAAKLGSSFVLDKVVASINDDLLRRARSLHDTMFSGKSAKGADDTDGVKSTQPAQVGLWYVSAVISAVQCVSV